MSQSTEFVPVRPRLRRQRHQGVASRPATVHVTSVFHPGVLPEQVDWVFDQAVADPVGSVAGLSVNGQPGVSWLRQAPHVLSIRYALPVAVGQTWNSSQGAGGILGADGGVVAAGSGTVEESI